MVKNLISRLKKRAKMIKLASGMGVLLALAGCPNPIITPQNAPVADLSVSPDSGEAPLKVKIDGSGTAYGSSISGYELEFDYNRDKTIDLTVPSLSPISKLEETLTSDTDIYLQVTDTNGMKSEKVKKTVLVSQPNIPDTGDPSVDFSSLKPYLAVPEGQSRTITLPDLSSADPDSIDNPVVYTDVSSSADDITASIKDGKLSLTGKEIDSTENYKLTVGYKTNRGKAYSKTLDGVLFNLPVFSGKIENCSTTNSVGKAVIDAFDANDFVLSGMKYTANAGKNLIGTATAGDDGSFTLSTNSDKQLTSGVILQAMAEDASGKSTGYTRSLKFSSDNDEDFSLDSSNSRIENGVMRVVPYPDPSKKQPYSESYSASDFRNHMRETNMDEATQNGKELGLSKFDLNSLKGIEVLYQNPVTNDIFSSDALDRISKIINSANGIREYINGKSWSDIGVTIQIDNAKTPDSQKHYNIGAIPNEGYVIIIPDNSLPYGESGQTSWGYKDRNQRIYNAAAIHLKTNTVNDVVTSHEFGHVFINSNDLYYLRSGTLSPQYTIDYTDYMNSTPKNYFNDEGIQGPRAADIESSSIVNEKTYPGRETLSSTMNLGFLNSGTDDGYDVSFSY